MFLSINLDNFWIILDGRGILAFSENQFLEFEIVKHYGTSLKIKILNLWDLETLWYILESPSKYWLPPLHSTTLLADTSEYGDKITEMKEGMNEWRNEWVSEWMSEGMTEAMNLCLVFDFDAWCLVLEESLLGLMAGGAWASTGPRRPSPIGPNHPPSKHASSTKA